MSVRYCEQREGGCVVDSTIARGGETPWLGGACVWQAGSWGAQPKVIVQSVGAKGERVHYLSLLSRQLLSTELISWSAMSVGVIDRSISQFQKYLLLPWESKSFGPP